MDKSVRDVSLYFYLLPLSTRGRLVRLMERYLHESDPNNPCGLRFKFLIQPPLLRPQGAVDPLDLLHLAQVHGHLFRINVILHDIPHDIVH